LTACRRGPAGQIRRAQYQCDGVTVRNGPFVIGGSVTTVPVHYKDGESTIMGKIIMRRLAGSKRLLGQLEKAKPK